MKKLSNEELLAELEVPFPVDQALWRVTNTANNRTRGQVVPYADPRAYTDRLNALVRPQGWTRTYETVTMNNITRTKRNAEIVTGKILVTCKVTVENCDLHARLIERVTSIPDTGPRQRAFDSHCPDRRRCGQCDSHYFMTRLTASGSSNNESGSGS